MPITHCEECKVSIVRESGQMKTALFQFCSKTCRTSWRTRHWDEYHPKLRVIVTCSSCGSNIEKLPSRTSRKNHFCDKKCKAAWQRIHLHGSGNPRYGAIT